MMPDQPFTSFAIFATMRSGSNLLERLINQYEGIHCHGELFNKGFIGASDKQEYYGVTRGGRDQNPQTLMQAIKREQPGIVHGFRIFGDHIDSMIEATLQDKSCAKIILRRNPVDSFVSLNIARKTNQWLIHNESDRKPARISFNLRKYHQYLEGLNKFYQRVTDVLAQTDQPVFEIDYDELADIDKINQMAKFIGDFAPKAHLEQPIKRQNPGSLAEKIINYDEIREALDLPVSTIKTVIKETGTMLSRLYFCDNSPLAFAPIPAAPAHQAIAWINSFDVCDNGFSEKMLADWRKNFLHPLAFSVTRHPVMRAYDVFMRKIFDVGPGSYLAIRETLCKQYTFELPKPEWVAHHDRAALENKGYGIDQHRVAFKQFLTFVSANLSGDTDIRQDGKWQPQMQFIEQYNEIFPELLLLKEPELRLGLMYLQNRLGRVNTDLPYRAESNSFLFSLFETYDAETEALANACYAKDYAKLGYGPLSSL